ncbi:hypothetical protein EV143_11393 [Flavobacterium chryseum]|uniref:hypothetical protein n=1 Tax=Flavobacterium sp. P3160 TaxID=2512113 RepID=UPI00105D4DB9|nr:hypothetical protein [Flavobacterium sp. P3160]TDO69916.1 hypothetical protein EV143_11393 [Flavobacterium sp. P3160]
MNGNKIVITLDKPVKFKDNLRDNEFNDDVLLKILYKFNAFESVKSSSFEIGNIDFDLLKINEMKGYIILMTLTEEISCEDKEELKQKIQDLLNSIDVAKVSNVTITGIPSQTIEITIDNKKSDQ